MGGGSREEQEKKITWICGMEAKVFFWVLETFIQYFKKTNGKREELLDGHSYLSALCATWIINSLLHNTSAPTGKASLHL